MTTRDSQEDLSGPPAANRHRLRASSLFDPPAPAKATEIEITEEDEILAEIRENENQNDDIGDAG